MPLAPTSIPVMCNARQALREIALWTTRDGREIPLDDMSCDHIANAVRVLSLWRSRLKKRGGDEAIVRDLANAISRFKLIQRQRRKLAVRLAPPADQKPAQSSPNSSFSRRRKPVAST